MLPGLKTLALPNDGSDAAPAFQAQLKERGRYHLPDGDYHFLTPAMVPSRVAIYFGDNARIIHPPMSPALILNQSHTVRLSAPKIFLSGIYDHAASGQLEYAGQLWSIYRNNLAAALGVANTGKGANFPACDILMLQPREVVINDGSVFAGLTANDFQHSAIAILDGENGERPSEILIDDITVNQHTFGVIADESSKNLTITRIKSDDYVQLHSSPGHLVYLAGSDNAADSLHQNTLIDAVIDNGEQFFSSTLPVADAQNNAQSSLKVRGGHNLRIYEAHGRRSHGLLDMPGLQNSKIQGSHDPRQDGNSDAMSRAVLITSLTDYRSIGVHVDIEIFERYDNASDLLKFLGDSIFLNAKITTGPATNKGYILNWNAIGGEIDMTFDDQTPYAVTDNIAIFIGGSESRALFRTNSAGNIVNPTNSDLTVLGL